MLINICIDDKPARILLNKTDFTFNTFSMFSDKRLQAFFW